MSAIVSLGEKGVLEQAAAEQAAATVTATGGSTEGPGGETGEEG